MEAMQTEVLPIEPMLRDEVSPARAPCRICLGIHETPEGSPPMLVGFRPRRSGDQPLNAWSRLSYVCQLWWGPPRIALPQAVDPPRHGARATLQHASEEIGALAYAPALGTAPGPSVEPCLRP